MTSSFDVREIIEQTAKSSRNFEGNRPIVKAHQIGKDFDDKADVDGRPGFVWVREFGMNGAVFQAFNVMTDHTVDLAVLISYSPKPPYMWEVIKVDWASYRYDPTFDGNPHLGAHGFTHEWPDYTPGIDVVNIFPRAMTPLRVTSGDTALTIDVNPYLYEYKGALVDYFGQFNVPISTYIPASGSMKYILVYLDKATNIVAFEEGEEVAYTPLYKPPFPAIPSGDIVPSALLHMIGGMTSLLETAIRDARMLYGFSFVYDLYNTMTKMVALAHSELDYTISRHIVEG